MFVHQHQYLSLGQEPDSGRPPFSEGTQHKETEEALARLFTIVNSSQDAIISQPPQGIITSWNAGAYRLYGNEAVEVLGRPMTLLIPEGRRAEYAQLMDCLRRGEHIHQVDTMHQHKNRTSLPISLIFSPLHNLQGELVGVATIARNSSERTQAQFERVGILPPRCILALLRLKGWDHSS